MFLSFVIAELSSLVPRGTGPFSQHLSLCVHLTAKGSTGRWISFFGEESGGRRLSRRRARCDAVVRQQAKKKLKKGEGGKTLYDPSREKG